MEKIKDVKNFDEFVRELKYIGFQASNLGIARSIFKRIIKERDKITVYFSFTANMVASGIRGHISEFIKQGYADVAITTAGALEHDLIKSFFSYYLGDFEVDDSYLHKNKINRIGNIFVESKVYEFLESVNIEIFSKYIDRVLTPSKLAVEYAKYIEKNSDKKYDSFLYNAYKRSIPIFCPGIVDGAIGLNTYFFRKLKKENRDFNIDIARDLDVLGEITLNSQKTAGIVLGGGISKHHLIGSNIIRGGLDYAIYLTTSPEYDGSLSGAKPREAISWGKIRNEKNSAVVYGDVSINFPLFLNGFL